MQFFVPPSFFSTVSLLFFSPSASLCAAVSGCNTQRSAGKHGDKTIVWTFLMVNSMVNIIEALDIFHITLHHSHKLWFPLFGWRVNVKRLENDAS